MRRVLVLLVVLVSSITYSQSFKVASLVEGQMKNGSISGVVLDHEVSNEPLAFATITVKETAMSTTSELDGTFSFDLKPGNYTLVYSFIGYKTIEVKNVKVTSRKTVNCNQLLSALRPEMPVFVSQLD